MPEKQEPAQPRTQWISLKDAAARYDVSVTTLRRAISRGDLPAGRCGRRIIRLRSEDLDAFLRPIPPARQAHGAQGDAGVALAPQP